MANQYVNKIVRATGEVELDLTGDTIQANKLLSGFTAHDKSGAPITGTCDYDTNTSGGTVSSDEVLAGEVCYSQGSEITGTMINRGTVTGTISTKEQTYTIPNGFHDGSGSVSIASSEQAKIIAGNIKSGVQILGVTGSYGGEQVTAETVTVTPSFSVQHKLPENSDYISEAIVNAIPMSYTDNSAGGRTLTIG